MEYFIASRTRKPPGRHVRSIRYTLHVLHAEILLPSQQQYFHRRHRRLNKLERKYLILRDDLTSHIQSVVGPFVMYYDDNRQHRPSSSSTHRPCARFGIHSIVLSRNTLPPTECRGTGTSIHPGQDTPPSWQTSWSLAIDRCIVASTKPGSGKSNATSSILPIHNRNLRIYRFAITSRSRRMPGSSCESYRLALYGPDRD
jgi:hypothetical protein